MKGQRERMFWSVCLTTLLVEQTGVDTPSFSRYVAVSLWKTSLSFSCHCLLCFSWDVELKNIYELLIPIGQEVSIWSRPTGRLPSCLWDSFLFNLTVEQWWSHTLEYNKNIYKKSSSVKVQNEDMVDVTI